MSMLVTSLTDPRLRADLTRVLRRRLAARDVEDVVQATLLEALKAAVVPVDGVHARRFVFSIARQKVADFYRKRRHESYEQPEVLLDAAVDAPAMPACELLHWARRELPRARHSARTLDWMLREGDGEALEEIAREERLPPTVVRQRVSRLRRFFRSRWAQQAGGLFLLFVALGTAWMIASRRERLPESKAPPIVPSPEATELRPVPIAPPPPAPTTASSSAPAPKMVAPPKPVAPPVPLTSRSTAFDRVAAAAALAKVKTDSCAMPAPYGHASVTFAPDGTVALAIVDSGPLMGTAAGSCVVQLYLNVRIAPFEGAPVSVGKTFGSPPASGAPTDEE
jgi:DNA-directed RNA polymerase specialized sigma24 family protein